MKGVFERSDGRWVAQLYVNGKPKQRTAKDEKGALKKYRELERAAEQGLLATAMTVKQYLDFWLTQRRKSLSERTVWYYLTRIDHINHALGHKKLVDLKPLDIQDATTRWAVCGARGKPLSSQTVAAVYATLRTALKWAVRWELLPRNPADAVDPPKLKQPARRFLSVEETRLLLESTEGDELHELWWLLATTGLRIGEATALRWMDIDLDRHFIAVHRNMRYMRKRGLEPGEVKTEGSRAIVYVPSVVCEKLAAIRGKAADEELIFQSKGKPYYAWVVNRILKRAMLGAGLDPAGFSPHKLRHTSGSLYLAQGEHMKTIQEHLRHSSYVTTSNIYAHIAPGTGQAAAERLGEILSRRDTPSEAQDLGKNSGSHGKSTAS